MTSVVRLVRCGWSMGGLLGRSRCLVHPRAVTVGVPRQARTADHALLDHGAWVGATEGGLETARVHGVREGRLRGGDEALVTGRIEIQPGACWCHGAIMRPRRAETGARSLQAPHRSPRQPVSASRVQAASSVATERGGTSEGVVPGRSAGGQRLSSRDEVDRLRRIRGLIDTRQRRSRSTSHRCDPGRRPSETRSGVHILAILWASPVVRTTTGAWERRRPMRRRRCS